MNTLFRPALSLFALLTLLTGVVYPLFVTAAAQLIFPHQANGSLITRDGTVVGSELIGQSFTAPQYFWGRPSATGGSAYNGAASGGSNLGPNNPALVVAVTERAALLREGTSDKSLPIPVDLVTASGSGLDPHISIAAAHYQAERVARLRGVDVTVVQALIAEHSSRPAVPGFGEPIVNVLAVNLALDGME